MTEDDDNWDGDLEEDASIARDFQHLSRLLTFIICFHLNIFWCVINNAKNKIIWLNEVL